MYAEFIMAFTPFFLLFLGIIQLAFIAAGSMVVQTAAVKAVRAASVILPDDRFFYEGERELLLDFEGSSSDSGFASSLGGKLDGAGMGEGGTSAGSSMGSEEGGSGSGGPRLNQIRLAAYIPLSILAPDPALLVTWVSSGLGLERFFEGAALDKYSLRKTGIGESPTARFLTGFLAYNALAAAINFPKAPGSAELHNAGEDYQGRVDFAELAEKSITVRITYLFSCSVPIVNLIVCRKIDPGPLWGTLARSGLDDAALDACGDSCRDVVAQGEAALDEGKQVIRDLRQQYDDAKSELKEAYEGTKAQVKQQYGAAKSALEEQYEGTKKDLKEQYDETKERVRGEYQAAKREARDRYAAAKQQASQEYARAKQQARDEYERAKREVEGQGREARQRVEESYRAAREQADNAYRDSKRQAEASYQDARAQVEEGYKAASAEAESARDQALARASELRDEGLDSAREAYESARDRANDAYGEGVGAAKEALRGGADEVADGVEDARRKAEEQLEELAPSGSGLPGGTRPGMPGGSGPSLPSGSRPGMPGGGGPSLPGGGLPGGGLPGGKGGSPFGAMKEVERAFPAHRGDEHSQAPLAALDLLGKEPHGHAPPKLPAMPTRAAKDIDPLARPALDHEGPDALQGALAQLDGLGQDVAERAQGAAQTADRQVSGAARGVERGAAGVAEDVERRSSDAVQGVEDGVSDAVQDAEEGASGAVQGVEDGVTGAVQDAEDGVSGAVDDVEERAGDLVTDGEGWISDVVDDVKDMLPDWFDDDEQSPEDKALMEELRAGVKSPTLLDVLLNAASARFYVMRAEATLPLQVAPYRYPTFKNYEEQDQQEQQEREGNAQASEQASMPSFGGLQP